LFIVFFISGEKRRVDFSFVLFFSVKKMIELMWWVPAGEAGFPKLALQHIKEGWNSFDALAENFIGVLNFVLLKLQEVTY
jgi:hypothetical protein